jgi:hypothetical protein
MKVQAYVLKRVIVDFFSAESFLQIVALYIALDILLANLLVGLYKSRLMDFKNK